MQSSKNKGKIKRARWALTVTFSVFLFLILEVVGLIFFNSFPYIERYYIKKELQELVNNYEKEINEATDKGSLLDDYTIISKGEYYVYYPKNPIGKEEIIVQKGFINYQEILKQIILKNKFKNLSEQTSLFSNNFSFLGTSIKERFLESEKNFASIDEKFFKKNKINNKNGISSLEFGEKKIYVFNQKIENKKFKELSYQAVVPSSISKTAISTFIFYYQIIILSISVLTFLIYYISSKEILEPIEEANEKIRSFADNIGHEIMSPLTVISGVSQLGLMGKKMDAKQIKENTDAIIKIIQTIKKLSFIERNQFEIQKFDLEEEIHQFLKEKDTKETLIKKEVKKNLVKGNKELLHLILENLYGNAIKYKEKGTKVLFYIKNSGIEISNKTSGIEKKDLNKLTERFFQADNSRSSNGSGLGLAMVKEACTILNWKINFELKDGHFSAKIKVNKGKNF